VTIARFEPGRALRGDYVPPPDKSISHRAALFGAMADEPVIVRNYLDSRDTRSTIDALLKIGAAVDEEPGGTLLVRGVGLRAPLEATGGLLDVGNSGTLMRLLPGWLAGQPGAPATRPPGPGRWTGWPSRCARWGRRSRRARGDCRPSRCAAPS
jgi:3-phosphoshikimate 1-carboxyvinyltransferase